MCLRASWPSADVGVRRPAAQDEHLHEFQNDYFTSLKTKAAQADSEEERRKRAASLTPALSEHARTRAGPRPRSRAHRAAQRSPCLPRRAKSSTSSSRRRRRPRHAAGPQTGRVLRAERAPAQVNINSDQRKELEATVRAGNIDLDTFVMVEKEALYLLVRRTHASTAAPRPALARRLFTRARLSQESGAFHRFKQSALFRVRSARLPSCRARTHQGTRE
jgi:hypothetical protein